MDLSLSPSNPVTNQKVKIKVNWWRMTEHTPSNCVKYYRCSLTCCNSTLIPWGFTYYHYFFSYEKQYLWLPSQMSWLVLPERVRTDKAERRENLAALTKPQLICVSVCVSYHWAATLMMRICDIFLLCSSFFPAPHIDIQLPSRSTLDDSALNSSFNKSSGEYLSLLKKNYYIS